MRGKKAVANIGTSLLLQLITIVCGFIVPKLIITKYGSSVNGIISSITQFLAYITLLESGFGPVVKATLYKPIAQKKYEEIEKILKASERFFRKISYIFIIYILILCMILPNVLSNEFDKWFTLSLILIISISTFAEYYFGITYMLYLQAEQKSYVISIIKIGTVILNTICIIFFVSIDCNIQIVKLGSSMIFILRPIVQGWYVKKKYNINLKKQKGTCEIKQKWDGMAQHIAYVIHNNTDIVLLTLLTSTVEVSVYSVYIMVTSGIKKIVQAFTGGMDASFGDMIVKKENDKLNENFKIYENFYHTIATIIGISTMFLIIPFVGIYTNGIKDANYIRPMFAYLIVAADFIWLIRLPYNGLVLAAGHFKETRRGSWIEAIINITVSLVLVWKFGLVGVAIGTVCAMSYRTIEIMYYASKHILERSVIYTLKRFIVIFIEFIIVYIILNKLPELKLLSYTDFIIKGCLVTSISIISVLGVNYIVYKNEFKKMLKTMKNILKRRR